MILEIVDILNIYMGKPKSVFSMINFILISHSLPEQQMYEINKCMENITLSFDWAATGVW